MIIYFASGKSETVDMDKREFDTMIIRMKTGGVRFLELPNGCMVPLNSNTIEYIDSEGHGKFRRPKPEPTAEVAQVAVDKQIESVKQEIEAKKAELATEIGVQNRENPAAMQAQEVNPITGAEREKQIIAKILEKSNCKHEQSKLRWYKTVGKKGERYFQVCSFCGWRGKFVKAESISDEDKANAAIYAN